MLDHDLHREFPELSGRIHELKITDAHFAKLYQEFDALDHEILGIEANGSPIGDAEMEALKLRRIRLKDRIYAYFTNSIT